MLPYLPANNAKKNSAIVFLFENTHKYYEKVTHTTAASFNESSPNGTK
jgi:hypothetical protein